ncbi:glycosyltransferase [Flavobacterium sp.]|uniref:glycosyltransferase n=1 Tax=Flavobacterium sp. TaxID=239 RepID=UPI003BDF9844
MANPKKDLLFVMSNLRCGGAEKALISLLQTIDYELYNVDLQLFSVKGLFLKQLASKVKLLPSIEEYHYFDMSLSKALLKAFKKRRLDIIYNRIIAGYIFKTEKNLSRCEQRVWKCISRCVPKSSKKYDAVFGFLEKSPVYYAIEKVNAIKKIGFVHNDYDKLEMDKSIDLPYFDKLDFIATDSKECGEVLVKNFPSCDKKIKIIFNIVSPTLIKKFAVEQITDSFPKGIKIVSIGRLENQKGYDFAVDALKIVKEAGYQFHWIILGEGVEKSKLVQQITKNNLEENVTFVGIKENLYPYVKMADIFIQTSRFEGKSVAIDEAKIVGRPILVTNFSTVGDQIIHKETGYITEMNPEAIAAGIIELLQDENLRAILSENLSQLYLGTESEINKIYDLVQ